MGEMSGKIIYSHTFDMSLMRYRAAVLLVSLYSAFASEIMFQLVAPPRLPTQTRLLAQGVAVDAVAAVVVSDPCLPDFYFSVDQCLPCDCGEFELMWAFDSHLG